MALVERAVPTKTYTLNDVFEAEQALIGLILSEPKVYGGIAGILCGEDWTVRLHRGVFEVAGDMIEQGRAISLAAILPRVSDVGPDGAPAGRSLTTLVARAPLSALAPSLAHGLAAAARERAAGNRFSDYLADPYAWAYAQAERLRRGNWSEIDALNLAEEIEDLGGEIYNKLESALRITLMHLLKWERQPNKRSRSWTFSIRNGRLDAETVIERHPGVKGRLALAISQAHRRARIDAAGETDLDESVFPEICPYTYEDIMTRPVPWPPAS